MQNINPKLWGPHGWKFLHYITLAYPDQPKEQDKKNIVDFFQNISKVLPCEKCRINFNNNLIKYPLNENIVQSRDNLVNWLIDVHNEVNIETGKDIYNPNNIYDDYLKCNNNNTYLSCGIIVLILIILVLLMFILRFHRRGLLRY